MSLHSEGIGRGAEFSVDLPLRRDRPAVALQAADRTPEPAMATAHVLRVMVVDDNRDSADMLALSLRLMGHQVRAHYDPLEVVAAAVAFSPDLIFMDVGMPVLNGFDLATRVRAQFQSDQVRPYLVALTGWGQEEDRRRSEAAGFDLHLVKPAELETIERVCRDVSALLAGPSAGQ